MAKDAPETVVVEKTAAEKYQEMVAALRANRPATKHIEIPSTDSQEGNSMFVAVNGRRMLIPFDQPVDVPYEIAKVIENSRKADRAALDNRRRMAYKG